jgi:AraC family transcriptional regulator of adaptative response / DNA-3-methyladenine glycosylase II
MMTSDERRYQAVLARDARFDGAFFVAVRTTGIYCRPICPARPKRENVEFFATAQAAEAAGYRPCLRCRPESAPGSPAWNGTSATVERALRLMAQGTLQDTTEQAFADRLGITARHLRRLFEGAFGCTPKQLHDAARLDFARKLIVETHLPMTEIAFAAGFRSVRRFNAAVKARFQRPPSRLRSLQRGGKHTPLIRLSLAFRPPYQWRNVLDYYRRHRIDGVETIENESFSRVFYLRESGTTGFFRVRPHGLKPELLLELVISDTRQLMKLVQRIRRMFDLDADPLIIAKAFTQSPPLKRLHEEYLGARLAGGFDPFETAIGTILGQVVSVGQSSRLMSQLVSAYGEEIPHPLSGERTRVFPGPQTLAEADLVALKITTMKREAIRRFSRQVHEGALDFDRIHYAEAFKAAVRTIPGIGAWSAEYILLRGLGDSDAFPANDLIVRRFLKANPDVDPDVVRPWRAYLAVCIWGAHIHVSHEGRTHNHAGDQDNKFFRRTPHTGGERVPSRRGALARRWSAARQDGVEARRP